MGRPRVARPARQRQPWAQLALLAVGGVAVLVAAVWLMIGRGDGSTTTPEFDLPAGAVSVAGLEAPQPVANLGTVPVDTPVRAEYTVRNTGIAAVTLGKAGIEVLEGC